MIAGDHADFAEFPVEAYHEPDKPDKFLFFPGTGDELAIHDAGDAMVVRQGG